MPPLLIAAFAYFFRREVETNPELAHGLFFDGLRQLFAIHASEDIEHNLHTISGAAYGAVVRVFKRPIIEGLEP